MTEEQISELGEEQVKEPGELSQQLELPLEQPQADPVPDFLEEPKVEPQVGGAALDSAPQVTISEKEPVRDVIGLVTELTSLLLSAKQLERNSTGFKLALDNIERAINALKDDARI